VNGQIHTNTIEGVFSLLDRSIIGAYHKVSKKHLPRYLDEVEWRYNNRENPYLFRDTILELVKAEQLEYKKLTA
jgi:transposase-like protein